MEMHRFGTRRQFLAQTAAAAWSGGSARAADTAPPNIIFLLTDDQRWDSLGCMGNPIIRTPNIDQLASNGVTFSNHFVTTSICMTSRASIFTGLYARAHQINDFSKPLPEPIYAQSYPALLRAAGYRTGFIGKWGLGGALPRDRFDYFQGFTGQGRYFPQAGGKHLTRRMGEQALEFLGGSSPGRPFCLSVSFKAPHVQDEDPRQFLYDPAHKDLYKEVNIPVPKTADPKFIEMLPVAQRTEMRRRWSVRFSVPALFQESVKSYYRLITGVDDEVGRIREELRRSGLERNTVIVYTGDNGFYLGEHGLAGKWLMHEESIRTPLILYDPRLPGSTRGRRRSEMTLNIDLAPTLLASAGVPVPPSMQGRSLRPLLEGTAPAWRKEWFYEHWFTSGGWIPRSEGVRTQTRKYARYLDSEPLFEELYDLEQDPLEERNLAADNRRRQELQLLRTRWETWRARLDSWRLEAPWSEPDQS
jgi:arylsulfatase A-like enzyme